MLYFKDVPIVVEPGVGALEVGIINNANKSERLFYAIFERVELTETTAAQLPFVPSSSAPHVFTMTKNLDQSPFLLVYDYLGKLSYVYTRDQKSGAWLKNNAAPEQVGETVTQFSVRLSFDSAQIRDEFLDTLDNIVNKYNRSGKIARDSVVDLIDTVTLSKVGPVVLPVAVAKATMDA
jgi:hypothetical protein